MVDHRLALVFAQHADPISGGAGWVGAGLLGLVLGWLMLKHLPDKDRQIEKLVSLKDEQVRAITEDHRAGLSTVVNHCRDEMASATQLFREEMAALRQEVARPVAAALARMERAG